MMYGTAPNSDQLEVTIFGPGIGECVLVHVGNHQWLCVDSAIHPETKEPVAAKYLRDIGLSPSQCLQRIIVSHWHDDHCRGIAQLFEECTAAQLVMSSAMTSLEFGTYLYQHEQDRMSKVSSGVRELARILEVLKASKRNPKLAIENRIIWEIPDPTDAQQKLVEVRCLSPVDAQVNKFYREISALTQKAGETRIRATPQSPNHLSVAIWINCVSESILLGADLEDTEETNIGWRAVVGSSERQNKRARVFKVPHHGSPNGHNSDVWRLMLTGCDTYALLAPFNKGRSKLPGASDIARLKSFTPNLYSSAPTIFGKQKRRDRAVEKQIAIATKKFYSFRTPYSFVRLRNGGASAPSSWNAELFGLALKH